MVRRHIDAYGYEYRELNEIIKESRMPLFISNVLGHRFVGASLSDCDLQIEGVPGAFLGAFLDGGAIEVFGNVEEATGDTMNDGLVAVHGNAGDLTGYAMRGGRIYIRDDVGYRCGIHMKEYGSKVPVLVVGGRAGSFLGEYQAGGIIIVLNLEDVEPVGNFPSAGMHGGRLFIRGRLDRSLFNDGTRVGEASHEDMDSISIYLEEFANIFSLSMEEILKLPFSMVEPSEQACCRENYILNI